MKSPLTVSARNTDACGQCGENGLLQLCDAVISMALHALLPFSQRRDFISFFNFPCKKERSHNWHTQSCRDFPSHQALAMIADWLAWAVEINSNLGKALKVSLYASHWGALASSTAYIHTATVLIALSKQFLLLWNIPTVHARDVCLLFCLGFFFSVCGLFSFFPPQPLISLSPSLTSVLCTTASLDGFFMTRLQWCSFVWKAKVCVKFVQEGGKEGGGPYPLAISHCLLPSCHSSKGGQGQTVAPLYSSWG